MHSNIYNACTTARIQYAAHFGYVTTENGHRLEVIFVDTTIPSSSLEILKHRMRGRIVPLLPSCIAVYVIPRRANALVSTTTAFRVHTLIDLTTTHNNHSAPNIYSALKRNIYIYIYNQRSTSWRQG